MSEMTKKKHYVKNHKLFIEFIRLRLVKKYLKKIFLFDFYSGVPFH